MKLLYFTTLFTLIFGNIFAQDCMMPDSIVLNTQAQIDNFAIQYPDCTEIPGHLRIEGLPPEYDQITNLEGLSHITKIEGDLTLFRNNELESFVGFEGLNTILGGMMVTGNACSDFNGFNNLAHIGGYFEVSYNTQLASFDGLENLNIIGGDFSLKSSSLIEQINLDVDSIGGDFYLHRNEALDDLSLNELVYIGGNLSVIDDSLKNFVGLENLNYVGEGLHLFINKNLTSLEGLNSLSEIGGDITIRRNPALNSIEALNNTDIQGTLIIEENGALQSLNGLNNVETINNLTISENGSLETLTHLENLNYIEGSLTVFRNNALTNLQGLNSLDSISGDLSIWNTGLQNLDGLDNLQLIRGDANIVANYELENISGLSNLNEIGGLDSLSGNLTIRSNYELINLDGLENMTTLKSLKLEGQNLQDINGLASLTNIEDIDIQDYNLSNLSGLENLNSISGDLLLLFNGNLANSNLEGLEGLTLVEGNVDIRGAHSLEGLNNLVTVGGNMFIYNPSMLTLVGLNSLETVSGNLELYDCNSLLTMNGLENLEHIEGDLSVVADNLISLQGLNNLITINGRLGVSNNNTLTSLTGLENVTLLGEGLSLQNSNALTTLEALSNIDTIGGTIYITQNNALTSLAGIDFVNFVDIDVMQIKNNVNLSLCSTPSLCNYIMQGGETDIANNGQTCSDTDEILNYCTELTRLQTTTFYDINQNKIQDNNELEVFVGGVSFEPDMVFLYSNSVNQNLHFMPPGSYTVNYDQSLNPDWQLTTDSTSYFVSLEDGELEEVTFGIYPVNEISHIATMLASPPTRCNEFITFDITTKNLGTTIASGTTWFQPDENIQEIQFIDQPDTTAVALDYYGWNFTDLYPGHSMTWQVKMQIPGPPDFPIGGELGFIAYTDFTDTNGEDTSEGFRYNPEVQCSYDPNDKLVNPSRYHYEALLDEDLIYTIRFQNTGNAVAYDVVIKDTLDTNLDLQTFRVLGSSHADKLSTSMTNDGVLTFEFRNIFLPDSTANLEASQGYVSYLIRANEDIEPNTVIRNAAGIYFDQNPPVITNTTLNVMVDMLTSNEAPIIQNLAIFPNPNTGKFEVQGIREGKYKITDISGRIIQVGNIENNSSINISNQAQGVYFISINSNNNIFINKIIKYE